MVEAGAKVATLYLRRWTEHMDSTQKNNNMDMARKSLQEIGSSDMTQ
jgi:hypothetical protein